MKILFLVPYPLSEAPSQRFRHEQYFQSLLSAGHSYKIYSFLSLVGWRILYTQSHFFQKATSVFSGFLKRLSILPTLHKYDFVFIHREACPIGPPVIEWLIAKIFRKEIIYDFDDAIWNTDKQNESNFEKWFRCRKKVALICRWSYKVSCGNEYLCSYARQFNENVYLIPTTVDTEHIHNPDLFQKNTSLDPKSKLTIGWTGTHSTLKHLTFLRPVLQYIEDKHPHISILVIANKQPDFTLSSMEFITWSKQTEIEDLMKIDIGIMPLPDDEWSKGKCGFKALQYMALELPTVASAVGANNQIIQSGINGFLCSAQQEWIETLELLIRDTDLRTRIGKAGRSAVKSRYSVTAVNPLFLSLFS